METAHRILVVNLQGPEGREEVELLGTPLELRRTSCGGDPERAHRLIAEHQPGTAAIALDGLPLTLELGRRRTTHPAGLRVTSAANSTPVVDGHGVRASLERWGVTLANRAEPGIFAGKSVLMVPGLNHTGLAEALGRHASDVRYADPLIFFGLPRLPGVGSRRTLAQAAPSTLEGLRGLDYGRLRPRPRSRESRNRRSLFARAEVLAGDLDTICRWAPDELRRKTVVVESAAAEQVEELRRRGVSILVTLMPQLGGGGGPAGHSAAVLEAALVALRPDPTLPPGEDTYLDLIADLEWAPGIHYLQEEDRGIHRFAFVIHPLDVGYIHRDRRFRWTRYLPDLLVEKAAARVPPLYLSRITGGRSPSTGQRIEGYLYSLAATPREMMRRGARFTYDRLHRIARLAERRGARIMGLGAFTSVVGDAGATVAHECDIAITSGNSLTVAATLEAARQAMAKMGHEELASCRAMVVGATGSIGAVCSRLIAEWTGDVALVSIEPERLIDLKRRIRAETPGCRVAIGTATSELLPDCDLIISATSAFGQRVVDISRSKPGAVICDVARPPDIGPEEAATRPDVLVIEGGEVLIPGEIDFGYDIGLPPGVAYACLAETALLAMEGRFEDFTIGRELRMERVKEIYRLFEKHGFRIAGLRSLGSWLGDEEIEEKRRLAEALRGDPERHRETVERAGRELAAIPVQAKGVRAARRGPLPLLDRPRAWVGSALTRLGRRLSPPAGPLQ